MVLLIEFIRILFLMGDSGTIGYLSIFVYSPLYITFQVWEYSKGYIIRPNKIRFKDIKLIWDKSEANKMNTLNWKYWKSIFLLIIEGTVILGSAPLVYAMVFPSYSILEGMLTSISLIMMIAFLSG